MTIAAYSDLVAAVARWLNREDMGDFIPDFVTLAETRIAKVLRTADAETQANLSTVAGAALDLPADYLEARGVTLAGVGGLAYLTPAALADTYAGGSGGRPNHYTIIGRRLVFGPTPDAPYPVVLTYYAKAPALSAAAPTNWLLERHPDLLLYGALLESAPFLGEDQRLTVWGGLFDDALGRIQTADGRARWGGGPLTISFS